MEISIYTDYCLTCSESDRTYKVKQFAKENGLIFRMKSTYILKEWQQEAEKIGAKQPFIHLNGKTLNFFALHKSLMVEDEALKELL